MTPAKAAITADNNTKVYGQENPEATGTIDGVQNADPITLSMTTPRTVVKSGVGSYSTVPEAVGTAAVLANYTVQATDGVLRA